jgi:hypothetical protein
MSYYMTFSGKENNDKCLISVMSRSGIERSFFVTLIWLVSSLGKAKVVRNNVFFTQCWDYAWVPSGGE